eukprot:TRINITY_DN4067_c0_g1_i1.p1 TRINITY_DN4067_c0_g1~~TRINITY_DN4067_c0_g1_i1.p1  ORF type:complete len:1163 (-),score=352.24 TRINITY_DN4067_c0_g1_i1:383-3871(-)
METLAKITDVKKCEDELSNFAQFLIVNFCHISPDVRKAADSYIIKFVDRFPQILWNSKCLYTLLEMLEIVNKGTSSGPLDLTHVAIPQTVCPGTGKPYFLDLPEDKGTTNSLLKDVHSLCVTWLSTGIQRAPEEVISILQGYIQTFKDAAVPTHHMGFFLALEASATDISKSDKKPKAPVGTTVASHLFNILEKKTVYVGQVKGVLDFMTAAAADNPGPEVHKMVRVLSEKLDRVVARCKQGANKAAVAKEFETAVFESCALLVIHKEAHPDLLKKVVWSAAQIFTAETMQVAVLVWTWLLTDRPDLSEALLAEICYAWCWTVDAHLGLFDGAPRPPSPLSTQAAAEGDARRGADACAPHRVWVLFLFERLLVYQCGNRPLLDLIYKMVAKALTVPDAWSLAPLSLGTRFQLLLLAVRLHKCKQGESQHSELFFREQIFRCTFAWFYHCPVWYQPATRKELEEDTKAVIEFCRMVHTDYQYLTAALAAGTAASKQAAKQAAGVVASVASAATGAVAAAAAAVAASPIGNAGRVRADTLFTPDVANTAAVPMQVEESLLALTARLRLQSRLLVVLVGNEIQRITAWNNPLNRISLQIPDEGIFSFSRLSSAFTNRWTEHVNTAWQVSPRLAVQLLQRFSGVPEVATLVSNKVIMFPKQVLDCPEAVSLLVTEENVRKNIPELKYLAFWETTDPPTAMSFLRKEFLSHPLVTQYATRALSKFTPETLIFYLPQLLQTLRYDKSGFVEKYLVEAAGSSQLIAHQLIWNAQTYLPIDGEKEKEKEVDKADAEFAEKAGRVREQIIENFSAEENQAYEDEFGFFANFTAISGYLKNQSPKDRRKVLKEKLREVPVQGKVYLPTNPSITIHGVDPDNALCLQSAEKVPILVNFYVTQKENEDQYKMGCIFKSGDDIRQDMLAVQLIELFKRIFGCAGLDLYLFPYKIIATQPGCGIIELVPNTMSRDQLGHKYAYSMYDYFLDRYGKTNTPAFQVARSNFTRSMAAYAVVSYILQVKDRHNGNILIDDLGHIVHIDFGFLFDRTPGGNLGFEKSPFKLTEEMIDIMGGSPTADQFIWFLEQGIRAFLAAREYKDTFATLVQLMLDTNLQCFKRDETIKNLTGRFCPSFTTTAAAKFMCDVMAHAFSVRGTFFTYFYDIFQQWDNGIAM